MFITNKKTIFVEDKLRLNIDQVNPSLYSACIIFAEDRLHLGIAIQTNLIPPLSICTVFVKDKSDTLLNLTLY